MPASAIAATMFTDADGRYRFRTIVPALYTGRTRHYHVKVQAAGRARAHHPALFPRRAGATAATACSAASC